MIVKQLSPITAAVDTADVTTAEAVLAVDPHPSGFSAHGVLITLQSIQLAITQEKTEFGWRFRVEARTPLEEGQEESAEHRYEARMDGEKVGDREVMTIWAGMAGDPPGVPVADRGAIPFKF